MRIVLVIAILTELFGCDANADPIDEDGVATDSLRAYRVRLGNTAMELSAAMLNQMRSSPMNFRTHDFDQMDRASDGMERAVLVLAWITDLLDIDRELTNDDMALRILIIDRLRIAQSVLVGVCGALIYSSFLRDEQLNRDVLKRWDDVSSAEMVIQRLVERCAESVLNDETTYQDGRDSNAKRPTVNQ